MAEVHEAVAHGAHGFVRRVAIKRLRADWASDPSSLRMFFDEARIASRLHHAGIVSILDYGTVDGAPFQVLELVDGSDMGAVLRRAVARGQRVPTDVALYVVTEVAHALAYAHEATDEQGVSLGIVHRDVKPSNILVSKAGEVKLGDFGIALARERAARTTGDVARGTPSYMAPEQLLGGVVDARSDLFALGCCLHALLTGQSPMADPTSRVAILAGEPWMPSPLEPDVASIVARATKLAPEERHASAREMARDLGAALAKRLRTDVKTRMVEWLASLDEARAAAEAAAPTMTIMSTVGDRVFVSQRTTSERRTAPPPAPTAPSPRARRRLAPFVGGLVATLALAMTAVLGAIVGPRLLGALAPAVDPPSGAAPPEESASFDASLAPDAHDEDVVVDDTSTALVTPPASVEPSARAADAVSPPVRGGCRCEGWTSRVGSSTRLHESLCHPVQVRKPSCKCEPEQGTLCWVPFAPTGDPGEPCPELWRTMPESSLEGAVCSGYLVEWMQQDGATVRVAKTTANGRLVCRRCDDRLAFPRTHGAPCVGISNRTGKRVTGRVDCSDTLP